LKTNLPKYVSVKLYGCCQGEPTHKVDVFGRSTLAEYNVFCLGGDVADINTLLELFPPGCGLDEGQSAAFRQATAQISDGGG